MKRMLRMILAVLFFLCLLASPACAEGKRRALLVGCDHFVTQVDTYPASMNNVAQIAQALSGGTLDLAAIITRGDGVTDAAALAQLVTETFAHAREDDVSYFYISTHGLWEDGLPAGDMRFVLSDGVTESNITAYELRALFDRVPGTKVLLLDACHSGSMIGKGTDSILQNVFASPDYKILCSSGGSEESWFWSGRAENVKAGAGYFSAALANGLSVVGSFGADANVDGVITLSELKRYLLLNHGASTVQSFPEEDDFPIMTYDPAVLTSGRRQRGELDSICFEDSVLSLDDPTLSFSFTVLQDVRVAYQIIFQKDGRWDFEQAQLYWDNDEIFGVHGDTPGYLSPGYKEREIAFTQSADDDEDYGYALFQLLTVSGRATSVVSSRVLCVPPDEGDLALSMEVDPVFYPAASEELTMIVRHAYPCELTVTVEDQEGNTVRRLASRMPTRPQQLHPKGTTLVWNGLTSEGEMAEPGTYIIHVKAYTGTELQECTSAPFQLE